MVDIGNTLFVIWTGYISNMLGLQGMFEVKQTLIDT